MALYTRKKGVYVVLTREQIRRMQRQDEVLRLQGGALNAARSLRALSSWLMAVQKKALKLDKEDLVVTRLPNIDRLLSMADAIDKSVHVLKRGKNV